MQRAISWPNGEVVEWLTRSSQIEQVDETPRSPDETTPRFASHAGEQARRSLPLWPRLKYALRTARATAGRKALDARARNGPTAEMAP